MPRFRVEVEYVGRLTYVIDGDDAADAEQKAGLVFKSEDDIDGELRSAKATEAPPGTPDGSAMELFDGEEAEEDPDFDEDDEEAPLPDECDDNCLIHAKSCDGYCDHTSNAAGEHLNACMNPK